MQIYDFAVKNDGVPMWRGAFLMLLAAGALGLAHQHAALSETAMSLSSQGRPVERARSRDASSSRGADTTEAIGEMRDALAVPWARMFIDVEEALVPGVALLSIEPDVSGRSVRITSEARDRAAMQAFVAAIGAGQALGPAHPVSEEPVAGARGPVRFTVTAAWRR